MGRVKDLEGITTGTGQDQKPGRHQGFDEPDEREKMVKEDGLLIVNIQDIGEKAVNKDEHRSCDELIENGNENEAKNCSEEIGQVSLPKINNIYM